MCLPVHVARGHCEQCGGRFAIVFVKRGASESEKRERLHLRLLFMHLQ